MLTRFVAHIWTHTLKRCIRTSLWPHNCVHWYIHFHQFSRAAVKSHGITITQHLISCTNGFPFPCQILQPKNKSTYALDSALTKQLQCILYTNYKSGFTKVMINICLLSALEMILVLGTSCQPRAQIDPLAELVPNSPTLPETAPVQLHCGSLYPLLHSCR